MDNVLFSLVSDADNLYNAWLRVKAKGSEGGIDNVSISHFEEKQKQYIDRLSIDIKEGTYIPEPYKELLIPKDENEFRTLGLPCIRDKIVQQTIKNIIEPLLDKNFAEASYGYRVHKGPVKAIRKTLHFIKNEKRDWVTVCDIDRYFDNVSHNLLFEKLERKLADSKLIELIMLSIKMGRVTDKLKWKDTEKGLPQGNILSPLLSNFYLTPFDFHMLNHKYGFIRYADDFIILSHSENQAKDAYNCTQQFIVNNLKLHLNPDYQVKNIKDSFEFLGIRFTNDRLSISEKKFTDIKLKIKQGCHFNDKLISERFFQSIEGLTRYYGMLLPQEELQKIDDYIVNLLISKCNYAYNNNILKNKTEISEALTKLKFVSTAYKTSQKHYTDKIVSLCKILKKEPDEKQLHDKNKKLLQKRKKEYQKLESGTFDLILSSPGTFLGLTKNAVSVKKNGVKLFEKRLDNLKSITILAQGISLSSNVIQHCANNNISVNFIDYKGMPYAKIYSYRETSINTGLAQLNAYNNGKAKKIIQQIITGKISNQVNLLKYYFKYRKKTTDDFCISYNENIDKMQQIIKKIKEDKEDDIDTYRGTMFASEGRAAAIYWEMAEKLLNNHVEFDGREHKGASDIVNCMLNYGYAILYSKTGDAILKANLNPYISYIHKEQTGKPTLIYDLVEEFRQQAVDRPVFALISKNEKIIIENKLLDEDSRKRLAEKIIERMNTIEVFRKKEMRLTEIMNHQAVALADYLNGKAKSYKPYIAKW